MTVIHQTQHAGLTIRISFDPDPPNPREWSCYAILKCRHRRYNLGDPQADDMLKAYGNDKRDLVVPLYLYDHSGITISTKPFSCPWDSGQVGVAVVPYGKMQEENNTKRITKKMRANALALLEQEVRTYDEYLQGECYGYEVLADDGEVLDSCWGIYQDENPEDPKGYLMRYASESAEEIAKRINQDVLLGAAREVAA